MSNKDTIIEALTMQLKLEREGNLALVKRMEDAEKQEQKTPLKVLGLTVFTENRLRNGRVYDVETLQAMTNRDILAIPDMGKKALKEVLEALGVYASDIPQERVDETAKRKHEWVGLTDEEIYDYADKFLYTHGSNYGIKSFGKAIEAKLKEKNNGNP